MKEEIIAPVDTEAIESELTPEAFLRDTNKGNNKIYVVDAHKAPNTMREIGRLREIAFRAGGGGTGKSCDIDRFDTMTPPCRQLIVWDPVARLILGGYRYITGHDIRINDDGTPRIAATHMFRFALDNLWDGLGALTVIHPEIKYLFGKVTMYPGYNPQCRNMILHFFNKHFSDPDELVRPIKALTTDIDRSVMDRIFIGKNYDEDYRILNKSIRSYGINIPPLINAYMSLSPTMKVFGTAINDEFGNVEETGIFLAISEILEEKKQRHIGTFHPNH